MATRRPKVPRADALGSTPSRSRPAGGSQAPGGSQPSGGSPSASGSRPSGEGASSHVASGKGSQAGSKGAEVIKAEFGGERAPSNASTPAVGSKAPGAGKNSAGRKPTGTTSKGVDTKSPGKDQGSGKSGPAKEDRDLDPVPAKAFSGRMLALAVVMIAITILLAPTVKIFLEKRAEISALEAEIAGRKAEQTELNKQLSRWQDPNYVKQQARDRINMVMPGETGYWVFGGEEAAGTPGGRTGSGSSANPENLPWVDALWESIRRSATD
ncbi:septum formation initiator family protein [Paenarthrobacter sp. MSM-2-10-13]|uniref:FtsB family cell division protein n=1 Tax=Micrococcaceae TaxID=1268 RepID=UPI001420619F|nr:MULTISPECIES: septum formation initiator family protein [Micrococcaceae]NHW47032.1 septum formation initiator family protein [Paenarthrobacter sp. MSM-2-10-13]BCW62258.1 hypothetical protein StoSoilB22_12310 [Arthrobacter sp. StoSoilB22]